MMEIADEYFAKWCQYSKPFEAYALMRSPKREWITEVHVLWGDTGTGKTRYAVEQGAHPVWFDKSGFAHGYNNEEVLIFDEFDTAVVPRNLFLQLTDRYAFTVNIKGGSRNWNPKKIYITSNYSPEDWYGACPAVKRRITSVTHFNAPLVAQK